MSAISIPGVSSFSGDKILLYVHGATYPSETRVRPDARTAMSWMDYIARARIRCVPGGPARLRPVHPSPEMDQPPEAEPANRELGETAVKDVGAAVDFILKRRGVLEDQSARLVVGDHASWAGTPRRTMKG